jgi:hypothetical protein
VKVTFANDWTTEDGKAHKAGSTAELPNVEARTLIHKGKATASPATAGKETSAAAETATPAKGKGKD